jgi:hypothetical protein
MRGNLNDKTSKGQNSQNNNNKINFEFHIIELNFF